MTTDIQCVSLTPSLTDVLDVDPVRLTGEVPLGWKKTTAIVRDDASTKKRGAARQKKSDDSKRAAGLVRAWVPIGLVELAETEGWEAICKRASRKRPAWKFWG